jgi:hypothetical protein
MKDTLSIQAEQRILILRDQKVMLDFHLAELFGVETRALKQAVRRNPERFPDDFMFELSADESRLLVSQTVIPGLSKLGGAVPMAFTEHGVAMLSIHSPPPAVRHPRRLFLFHSKIKNQQSSINNLSRPAPHPQLLTRTIRQRHRNS